MNITKATRWRVFAGVWLQSLFTSATAYFSLFCIPLTTKFGWSDSAFALAYTIYMFTYCAVGFIGGFLSEKISPRKMGSTMGKVSGAPQTPVAPDPFSSCGCSHRQDRWKV